MMMRVCNSRTDNCIADQVEVALTFFKRLIGLLGRSAMPANQGLYFQGCKSVHTFFMRFPIDILFLDKDRNVTKMVDCLQPNRIAFGPRRTTDTLELACGAIAKCGVNVGDKIMLTATDCEATSDD